MTERAYMRPPLVHATAPIYPVLPSTEFEVLHGELLVMRWRQQQIQDQIDLLRQQLAEFEHQAGDTRA
jgi:hypothetical protein